MWVVVWAFLALGVGIAILRYRLWDIDLLINRTLVYGSLTLSLAALYIGGVLGLQALFQATTGQSSDLAIAIVTLAVAALFNPWRHQLQRFIDRRFYRHKYDAARVLLAFTSHLRDEVDLDDLSGDLVRVLQETVQPSSVSLWLRHAEGEIA
jgi:small basic protein